MTNSPPEDSALVRAAQRGNLDAFNDLILTYQDSAYTLAYRLLGDADMAADAAQEAVITAYQKLDTFRGGSFRAWLLRITANRCYDELRRLKRRPATSIEDMPGADMDDGAPLPDPSPTPETLVEEDDLQRAVQNCINALGAEQRLVLVLSDVENLPYDAIAAQMGTELGTVKSRLSRARANVRACLQASRELLPAQFRL